MILLLFLLGIVSGIGTVAFDTRLGLYEDPPPQEALKFIDAAQNFFTLTQTLLFSIPSNMVRRYIDTPTLKKFFKVSDDIIEIGQGFVDKKMRELKEMAKNETEPSGSTQGNRPFYSCGSVTRPMNGSEAAGDFVLIQSSLLFLCKCRLVSITTTQFT